MKLLRAARTSWRGLVVVLTPLLLCPLVLPYSQTSKESKCAALIILMAVYWITESLPLPMTSLLPISLCPLLGIASSKIMCQVFFGEVTFLLLGGIIVAIAIEESKLHKRMALRILMLIGVKPRRLMLGIMLTTAFLSMWISNTATTAMMMPITRALLAKLFSSNKLAKRQLVGSTHSIEDHGIETEYEMSTVEEITPSPARKRVSLSDLRRQSHAEVNVQGDYSEVGETAVVFGVIDEEGAISLDDVSDHSGPQQDTAHHRHHHHHHHQHQHHQQQHLPLEQTDQQTDLHEEEIHEVPNEDEDDDRNLKDLDPEGQATLKVFSLCVCYSANIGGIATLTGTPPNMVFGRLASEMSNESPITFASWFSYGVLVSLITLLAAFLWMNISVFGFRNTVRCRSQASEQEVRQAEETIKEEYRKLGSFKFNEIIVLIHFLLLVVLWLTRDPGSIPGWSYFFHNNYVSDGTTAIAVAISLFILPNQRPNTLFWRAKGDNSPARTTPAILTWRLASKKLPWGVAFLLGGGFALSKASQLSGLSKLIANKLLFIRFMPVWAAGLVVTTLTSALTEITSNTVITMLMLPILRDIAIAMQVHPLYFMMPATVASSLAFMLPVATPPNALVFAYGDLTVIDMMKSGLVLNVIGISVVTIGINTWGYAFFSLGVLPPWATPLTPVTIDPTNFTMTSPSYYVTNLTQVI